MGLRQAQWNTLLKFAPDRLIIIEFMHSVTEYVAEVVLEINVCTGVSVVFGGENYTREDRADCVSRGRGRTHEGVHPLTIKYQF